MRVRGCIAQSRRELNYELVSARQDEISVLIIIILYIMFYTCIHYIRMCVLLSGDP